jgi:hypothetical protein
LDNDKTLESTIKTQNVGKKKPNETFENHLGGLWRWLIFCVQLYLNKNPIFFIKNLKKLKN